MVKVLCLEFDYWGGRFVKTKVKLGLFLFGLSLGPEIWLLLRLIFVGLEFSIRTGILTLFAFPCLGSAGGLTPSAIRPVLQFALIRPIKMALLMVVSTKLVSGG